MKNFILLFVLTLIGINTIWAKSSPVPQSIFRSHFVYVEDCYKSVKHVYLKLDIDPFIEDNWDDYYDEWIDRIVIEPKWKKNQDGQAIYMTKLSNGYEIEILNQVFSGGTLPFTIKALSKSGKTILKEEHKAIERKENGIVDVSEHLDLLLAKFQASKKYNLAQFFCGQKISTIELIAFFRDYLKLSHSEMCDLIKKYNLLQKLQVQNQVNYVFLMDLCEQFQAFLDDVIDDEDEDCNCNLIRTNRTARNIGTGSAPAGDLDQCNDYDPLLFTENYEFGSDEDDLIVNGGRMGAAKGFVYVMQYNNGADSPNNFRNTIRLGWSELSFRSVCVDPITITPNIENCGSCVKDIELQYGYYTRGFVYGEKSWHISGSKLGMRAEEWATLTIQEGDEGNVVDEGGATYVIDCEAPDNTIQETLTEAADVIETVSTALSNITVAGIASAAGSVISFIENNITNQFCDELYDDNTTLLSGNLNFSLEPNGFFKAVINSGATLGGKTENNGRGFINLNSDFYMAAVVRTVAPDGEDIPEYCECEKIGGYVLGSMEGYSPLDEPIRDSNPIYNMNEVFEKVPFGDLTVRQLAGDYIGSFGPWAPKWDQQGCCSSVNLECQSECAYLSGCEGNNVGGSGGSTGSNEVSTIDFKIYPNPTSGLLNLNNPIEGELYIVNASGEIVYQKEVEKYTTLELEIITGIYYLKFIPTDKAQETQYSKLIIQN